MLNRRHIYSYDTWLEDPGELPEPDQTIDVTFDPPWDCQIPASTMERVLKGMLIIDKDTTVDRKVVAKVVVPSRRYTEWFQRQDDRSQVCVALVEVLTRTRVDRDMAYKIRDMLGCEF